MKSFFILSGILISILQLDAQSDHLALINGISKYRSTLMRDTQGMIALGVLLMENKKLSKDKKNVYSDNYLYRDSLRYANSNLGYLRKKYGDSSILTQLNIDVDQLYCSNGDLLSCMSLGILEDTYPFKIKTNAEFYKEWDYYHIHELERILFIGQSCYNIGKITEYTYNKLELILATPEYQYPFENLIKFNFSILDSSWTDLRKKSYLNTDAFEINKLDKIIIRYTHEKIPINKLLIKKFTRYLRNNGRLIITLADPDLIEDPDIQKVTMQEQGKLFKRLSNSGFRLDDKTHLNQLTLYQFSLLTSQLKN